MKTPELLDYELDTAYSVRGSLRWSIFGLLTILIVMLITLYFLVNATTNEFPRQEFVYTTNAAAVCAYTPLDKAGDITDANVRTFALQVAQDIHALDYVNFRSTLDRVTSVNFTAKARVQAVDGLRSSGILGTVTQQFFILRAVQRDTVEIISQQVTDGVYTWQAKVPLTLAYTSRGIGKVPDYRPEPRDIFLTIERTEQTAANPLGLRVSGFRSSQDKETIIEGQ